MANNNGIITEPGIGLEPDIYGTLGVGRHNGLFDTVYICCNIHGKINPNAKFKPTRAGSTPATPADWWKGPDGMCGFAIPRYDTHGNLDRGFIHDLISGEAAWTYNAPRENIDWSRLTDFEGYNHNAGEIFGVIEAGTYITRTGSGTLVIRIIPPIQQAQGQLLPSDFTIRGTPLSEFYMGVLLWSGSRYIIRTADTAGIKSSLTIPDTGITGAEDFNAVLFLSSVRVDGTAGVIGDYVAARNTDHKALRIINITVIHQVFVTFNRWLDAQYRRAEVSVRCTNNHPTESFTFTNIRVDLLRKGTTATAGFGVAADQEVAANSDKTVTVTLNTLIAQTGGTQEFELSAVATGATSANKPVVTINY